MVVPPSVARTPPALRTLADGRQRQGPLVQLPPFTARYGGAFKIREFRLTESLGAGAQGEVHKATIGTDTVVLKKFNTAGMNAEAKQKLKREIEAQSDLRHPNILQMYGTFWTPKAVYLILEYGSGGDLFKLKGLRRNERFPDERAAKYVGQVAEALSYCHSRNILHRDLKLENIIVVSGDNIKLADFGHAVMGATRRAISYRRTYCGTPVYMAPEKVRQTSYGLNADSWALGVLTFELIVGVSPFDPDNEENDDNTYRNILAYNNNLSPLYPRRFSPTPDAHAFMQLLLQKTPSRRMTMAQALVHSWITRRNNTRRRAN